jgi:hypothetical protein
MCRSGPDRLPLGYPKTEVANPPSGSMLSVCGAPPRARHADLPATDARRQKRGPTSHRLAPGALQVPNVVPDSDDLAPAAARARRHRVRPKPRHAAVARFPACLAHKLGNGRPPHAKRGGSSNFESTIGLRARTRMLTGTGGRQGAYSSNVGSANWPSSAAASRGRRIPAARGDGRPAAARVPPGLLDADSCEDLPGKWQAAAVEANRTRACCGSRGRVNP